MGRAFGYFPSSVRAQFAEDAPLQELGIEGYAGDDAERRRAARRSGCCR